MKAKLISKMFKYDKDKFILINHFLANGRFWVIIKWKTFLSQCEAIKKLRCKCRVIPFCCFNQRALCINWCKSWCLSVERIVEIFKTSAGYWCIKGIYYILEQVLLTFDTVVINTFQCYNWIFGCKGTVTTSYK